MMPFLINSLLWAKRVLISNRSNFILPWSFDITLSAVENTLSWNPRAGCRFSYITGWVGFNVGGWCSCRHGRKRYGVFPGLRVLTVLEVTGRIRLQRRLLYLKIWYNELLGGCVWSQTWPKMINMNPPLICTSFPKFLQISKSSKPCLIYYTIMDGTPNPIPNWFLNTASRLGHFFGASPVHIIYL